MFDQLDSLGSAQIHVRLRLPRFCWMKPPARPLRRGTPALVGSPQGDISTLMTSAPSSTNSRVQAGPARYWVKSSTRTPARYGSSAGAVPGPDADCSAARLLAVVSLVMFSPWLSLSLARWARPVAVAGDELSPGKVAAFNHVLDTVQHVAAAR